MYKRILVKVGTNLITDEKGIRKSFLKSLVKQVAELYKKGIEVLIVSSGAIGAGKKKMKIDKKALSLSEKQAIAAVGQIVLMQEYKQLFREAGIPVAQVLLDHDDVKHKDKNVNARNTISKLLEWKVVPIINENDTVATDEIKFGDNDALAGIVAGLVNVDLVIILTVVEGVFADLKDKHSVSYIDNIDQALKTYKLSGKTDMGTGGMASKLDAAGKISRMGIPVIITKGTNRDALLDACCREGNEQAEGKKADGTYIEAIGKKVEGKKKWILTSLKIKGRIRIDSGAKGYITDRGKSLLAVGVTGCDGNFIFGDAVEIADDSGNVIAKGMTNYSSEDLLRIKGKKSAEIKSIMGSGFYDEVIHRDNMFIYK